MQLSQPRILNQKFCILDHHLLGKGSTGDVYLGFYRNNIHNKVAIKVIDLKQIKNEVTSHLLACEIAALSNLGKLKNTCHDNVVKLHDVLIIDTYVYLIMELLQGKTLGEHIKEYPNGMPFQEALYLFMQILQGYIHISSKKIIHRDLKPDNIIFKTKSETDKKLAIIDFGYCEIDQVPNKPQMHYNVGSPKYMSPQAYKTSKYSQKSDIWALGIIFYEMLMGKTCDLGMSMQKYLQMIQNKGIPLPNTMNKLCQQILIEMLHYNPQNRSQCEKILDLIKNGHKILNHYRSQAIIFKHPLEQNRHNISNEIRKPQNMIIQSMIINNDQAKIITNNNENVITENKSNTIIQNNNSKSIMIHNKHITTKLQNANLQSVRQVMYQKSILTQQQSSGLRQSLQIYPQSTIENKISNKNIVQKVQQKKVIFNFISNNNADYMFKSARNFQGQSDQSTKNSNFTLQNINTQGQKQSHFLSQRNIPQRRQQQQYYSPQRQTKQEKAVQYFTQTKIISSPVHNQITPHQQGKPLINLQSTFGCGQIIFPYYQMNKQHDRAFYHRNQYNQRQQQHHLNMIQGYSN